MDTPPGWSSKTAPPPRGVRHYLTSVDPGPTASTDTHPSSWRMWRSAHMHIYEYIYRYFCLFSYVNTCDGEKHSADNLPPPHCYHLVKAEKPLRREGRPSHPGQPFFCYAGPSDVFFKTLSVQTNPESPTDRLGVQPSPPHPCRQNEPPSPLLL